LKYLVRSVTPGSYLYPGVEAKLQYAEEEFGRSASTRIEVSGS
jgi:alpha-2-macroglobulin